MLKKSRVLVIMRGGIPYTSGGETNKKELSYGAPRRRG